MSEPTGFPEDRIVRARRGELADSEAARLERELDGDAALRIAHEVGIDLDRATAVRAGDEALIARAADAALARIAASGLSTASKSAPLTPSQMPKRRRRIAALLAAALVCAAGMAAGMWAGVVPSFVAAHRATGADAPKADVHHAPSNPTRSVLTEPKRDEPALPATENADPAPSAPADPGASVARPERVAPRAAPEATAAALFKSANSARREGDFSTAERLYSELIGRYPTSDEAGLGRVSLGKLLLANGDPSDAEREFGRYLKGGRGQLTEEVLVSRAQSLQKLGRPDAERRTWERLLAEYPNSVYAAVARTRLDALRQGAPGPG